MIYLPLALDFPLFPAGASSIAGRVDAIFWYITGFCAFFSILISVLIIVFSIKYRRRSEEYIPPQLKEHKWLEVTWAVVPFLLVLVMFFWGAGVYYAISRPPSAATTMYVVAKQWMWKFQHPGGQREINELHVPAGTPIRMILSSEDVIHSLYFPAFRVKLDVLPGRYTTLWFEATKTGTYHLFCAEYCGTRHSGMIGRVIVMDPRHYQQWLTGGGAMGSLAEMGEKLFQQLGCITCHGSEGRDRGPSLVNLIGSEITLETGETITADESYIRESILNPRAKIVSGFKPIMPIYQGQVSEEQILELLAYIRSLATPEESAAEANALEQEAR